MKQLKKEINFDGINFWYRDLQIGQISDEFKLQTPIPKEIMDKEKGEVLGRVIAMKG